jgi:hypothetical protein
MAKGVCCSSLDVIGSGDGEGIAAEAAGKSYGRHMVQRSAKEEGSRLSKQTTRLHWHSVASYRQRRALGTMSVLDHAMHCFPSRTTPATALQHHATLAAAPFDMRHSRLQPANHFPVVLTRRPTRFRDDGTLLCIPV